MDGTVAQAAKPSADPTKRRTITLTNRRPVQFIEDDWPIVAEGKIGDSDEAYPMSWSIQFRVRETRRVYSFPRYIVYATYDYSDEIAEQYDEVRVGRYLRSEQEAWKLEENILGVGDELRQRIKDKSKHDYVTLAIDRCIASLGPQIL